MTDFLRKNLIFGLKSSSYLESLILYGLPLRIFEYVKAFKHFEFVTSQPSYLCHSEVEQSTQALIDAENKLIFGKRLNHDQQKLSHIIENDTRTTLQYKNLLRGNCVAERSYRRTKKAVDLLLFIMGIPQIIFISMYMLVLTLSAMNHSIFADWKFVLLQIIFGLHTYITWKLIVQPFLLYLFHRKTIKLYLSAATVR